MKKSGSENFPYEARMFCLSAVVVIPGVSPHIHGNRQFPLVFNRFRAMAFAFSTDGIGMVAVGAFVSIGVSKGVCVGNISTAVLEVDSVVLGGTVEHPELMLNIIRVIMIKYFSFDNVIYCIAVSKGILSYTPNAG
jgi:hypothetical protein